MGLRFYKLSGAGNDFVLLEEGKIALRRLPGLAKRLCDRREGIGADGILIVGRKGGRPRWSYRNADGSEAFCGNGARCAAWWMFLKGWSRGRRAFELDGPSGPMSVHINGLRPARVALSMPAPARLRLGRALDVQGRRLTVHSIDTGVPHAVVLVEDLERFPVLDAGRALRRHREFSPAGANADFITVAAGRVGMRTYERGVEAETRACGTGAVASAIVASALGKANSPVAVFTRSGERLEVFFTKAGPDYRDVWLEGPSRLVFEGEVTL